MSLFSRLALALRPRLAAADGAPPNTFFGRAQQAAVTRERAARLEYTTLLGEMPQATDDDAAQQAIAQRRQRRVLLAASRRGTRNGTQLTGPSGVTTPAPVARATLLGE
jgi:hypothetical protein